MSDRLMRKTREYRSAVGLLILGLLFLIILLFLGVSWFWIIIAYGIQAIVILILLFKSGQHANQEFQRRYASLYEHEVDPQACIDAIQRDFGSSLDLQSLSYMAVCKNLLQKTPEAIELTNAMLEKRQIKINVALLHMNLGYYYMELGEYEKAEQKLNLSEEMLVFQVKQNRYQAQVKVLKERIHQHRTFLHYLKDGSEKEACMELQRHRLYQETTSRCERLTAHYRLAVIYLHEGNMEAYQEELAYVTMLGSKTSLPSRLMALSHHPRKDGEVS